MSDDGAVGVDAETIAESLRAEGAVIRAVQDLSAAYYLDCWRVGPAMRRVRAKLDATTRLEVAAAFALVDGSDVIFHQPAPEIFRAVLATLRERAKQRTAYRRLLHKHAPSTLQRLSLSPDTR